MTADAQNHPDAQRLRQFAAGMLWDGDLDRIAEHLGDCQTCRAAVDELLVGDGFLDRLRSATTLGGEVPEGQAERRQAARALRREVRRSASVVPDPAGEGPSHPGEVGQYVVLGEVGRGGMGVVYQARHRDLRRLVALKMILAGGFASEVQRQRFRREAELAARVQHPHIVQVYEVGLHDGRPFLAMEWVDGGTLADRLGGAPWPPRAAAGLVETLARAIDAAHRKGVIHRDLKPSNILLQTDLGAAVGGPLAGAIPKVADFGLARALDAEGSLTWTGLTVGTPEYMAPEQAVGAEAGPAADIYALGAILYRLLTGQPPTRGDTPMEMLQALASAEPIAPRRFRSNLPRDLETITLQAMAREPRQRYETAEALAEDLRRFLAGEPIRARPVGAMERSWRWARRNPWIAAFGGVVTGVLVLATVLSLAGMQWYRTLANAREAARQGAERARADEAAARGKADRANSSLLATQEELRRTVYATRSNLAYTAWDANDVGRLRSLLDLLRPTPVEPDLRGWEWRYLWQLGHEERLTLRYEPDGFTDVVFSPDGQTLAGLEWNGRIHLWDRRTGQSRRTFGVRIRDILPHLAPRSGVHALAFSSDGRRIAGPGPDASLVLYAVDTGLPILSFEGDQKAVLDLAWSPDGRTLVGALSAHVMRVWNAGDGHLIHHSFGHHAGPVAAVAFSPDGRTLASAGYDHAVKLWNLEDHRHPLATLHGHTDEVRAVAFSPDGRRIASAGLDRSLRIWDARSGAELAMIRGRTGPMTTLAYGPDNAVVVTGSVDETVSIWDTAAREELRTFKGHTDEVLAVAFSPDGKDIASAGADSTVRVWDTTSPPRHRTVRSPSLLPYGAKVYCLAFSPDGRRLISGHEDHALRVWELPSGRTLYMIKGHKSYVVCVALSPDGRTIASGENTGGVLLSDAADGRHRRTLAGHTGEVGGLAFTPDGQTVLSGGQDSAIRAWDAATGVVRYVLQGHSGAVNGVAISPDGRTLASASSDQTCILWNLADRRPTATLRGHTGTLNRVAFSSDGRTLATSSNDDTVRLWDAATGSHRGILEGHVDDVYGLAFNPDGRLASSAWDRTVRLWDPASRQTVLVLKGHAGRIGNLAFSPDGRTLASASEDRTLMFWEAAPEAVLAAPPSEVQNAGQSRTALNENSPP